MRNILSLQKIHFDLQVKSGQLMLNDHTGTRLFIWTTQKQSGHQQWANAVENFLLCPAQLPPLWLWSTVPKNVSTPNRMGRHQSTEEQSTAGGRKGVCMHPTAAVPMVPLRDLGQTKAPLWASLSLYLPPSPAPAMWVPDWETGSQEPKQHLLSPWKSALSFCPPGSMCLVAWGRGLGVEGGRPLQHWARHIDVRVAKHDVDLHFNTAEVPLVGLQNTHHDNQENILEIIPMSKSVLDEKGKVSLQEL